MANVKITDLTAYTNPASTDVVPIVDLVNDQTKKVTLADIFQTFPYGSESAPSIAFDGDSNTGIYRAAADELGFSAGGTARLTVSTSAVTSALPVDVLLGSASTPSFTFTGDLDTGIYSPGANQVAVSTGGTGRLFIDSNGNCGIGTSSPAVSAHINSPTPESLRIQHPSSPYQTFYVGASRGAFILSNSSKLQIAAESASNNTITFQTSTNERMRLDSSGRLLLGTSSAPAAGSLVRIEKAASGTEGAGIHFGGTYSIADDATQTFTALNGCLVFVSDNNTGDGALFFCTYKSATVTLLSDPNGRYANSDTDGKICVFKSANSTTVSLKNRSGSTASITVGKVNNSD